MDQYGNEEEQVEALRRWWDENGKSTIAAVVIALASGIGWTAFKDHQEQQAELASDLYQSMQKAIATARVPAEGAELGEQLKREHANSTYAQFAALHLAARAVEANDLVEAEAQLRWVLGRADKGSDTERVAQLRLARVLAASGDADQALAILDAAGTGSYSASYATARGDILLAENRTEEAREAYSQALALAAANGAAGLPVVEQKLEYLMPATTTVIESEQATDPAPEEVSAPAPDGAAPDGAAPEEAAPDGAAPEEAAIEAAVEPVSDALEN